MWKKYLNKLFSSSEWINVCYSTPREVESSTQHAIRRPGLWVCVNPLFPHKSRKRNHLCELRNFVVEFDHLSPKEQMQEVRKIGMPYTTAVFSGNKSIHFVIALDEAVTPAEYRRLATLIKAAVPYCDKSCLEPARLTRMPNDQQPLVQMRERVTVKQLEEWLATRVSVHQVKPIHNVTTDQLTRKTMRYISGMIDSEEAHGASIHAAKNLFEIGYDYDEVLSIMTDARQLSLPGEDRSHATSKAERIVSWVYNEWQSENRAGSSR